MERDFAILEYGVKRKLENYEIEDEEQEVKGRYVVDWFEAGRVELKIWMQLNFKDY